MSLDISAVVESVGPRATSCVLACLAEVIDEARAPELDRMVATLSLIIEGAGDLDQLRMDCLAIMAASEGSVMPAQVAGFARPMACTLCSPLWDALADLIMVSACAARVDWLTFLDELGELINSA